MITYEVYTETGKRYYAAGNYAEIACRVIEKLTGERVSCWYICCRMPGHNTTIWWNEQSPQAWDGP